MTPAELDDAIVAVLTRMLVADLREHPELDQEGDDGQPQSHQEAA